MEVRPVVAWILCALLGALVAVNLWRLVQSNFFCDGQPYLYVTFHDNPFNIYKYSRNGCLLSTDVLSGAPKYNYGNHMVELRSLAKGVYNGSSVLFVADAFTNDSFLNIYSHCNIRGQRSFIRSALSTFTHEGVNHIYGIAFDQDENVYVSSQHTDNVMRFTKDSFEPMPSPPYMTRSSSLYYTNYPGTFKQYGQPNTHSLNEQGVRDIAYANNQIWIANEDLRAISVIDSITGIVEDMVTGLQIPIGLYYHSYSQTMFVSSKSETNNTSNHGNIYGISIHTKQITHKMYTKTLIHPTGMVIYYDTLYVAEQSQSQIYSFSLRTGKLLNIIVETENTLPGMEKIMLSEC